MIIMNKENIHTITHTGCLPFGTPAPCPLPASSKVEFIPTHQMERIVLARNFTKLIIRLKPKYNSALDVFQNFLQVFQTRH